MIVGDPILLAGKNAASYVWNTHKGNFITKIAKSAYAFFMGIKVQLSEARLYIARDATKNTYARPILERTIDIIDASETPSVLQRSATVEKGNDLAASATSQTAGQGVTAGRAVVTPSAPHNYYNILPKNGLHTPVFYDQNAKKQAPAAIVNAGSLDGHIGGASLNQVFADVAPFAGAPHRQTQFKQDLNTCLLTQGIGESNIKTYDLNASGLGMKSMMLYRAASDSHAGSVAVYEYAEPPYGNAANQAMVYVFPPKREDYATDSHFLAAVEQTAANMVTVYNYYAYQKRSQRETVPELHIHAFSAGIYSGQVPTTAITKAILKGVHTKCQELSRNSTLYIPKMQFSAPFDYTLARLEIDAHYLDSPQPIAIDQSLPESDQEFLAFFNGDGQINGHTRQSISHYPFPKLESTHDYIQGVFPNQTPGMAKAPLLSPTLLNVLNAPENKSALKKYIEDMLVHTMLPFWGIRHESINPNTGEVDFSQGQFAIDDMQQSAVWRTKHTDHNHLRITRIFNFLMEVGYQDYAQKLCQFLQKERQEANLPPIDHWYMATLPPFF